MGTLVQTVLAQGLRKNGNFEILAFREDFGATTLTRGLKLVHAFGTKQLPLPTCRERGFWLI